MLVLYVSAIVTSTCLLLGILNVGRRIFKHFFAGSFPERLVVLDGDDDDVFYDAQDGLVPTARLAGDGDRGQSRVMATVPRIVISPMKSKQTLVNCDSCFCCRTRKVISALFLSESDKSKPIPSPSGAVSEPSVSSLDWDWEE